MKDLTEYKSGSAICPVCKYPLFRSEAVHYIFLPVKTHHPEVRGVMAVAHTNCVDWKMGPWKEDVL